MEYVEIDYGFVAQTDRAVLIDDGDKKDWVPKSCIEDGFRTDFEEETTLSMALWFAEQEEWV